MAALVFRTHPGSTVAITVDQPLLYERLAERYGGHVRRCPANPQALMQVASYDSVTMAGDGSGYFVFPALHPAIDGLFALGKLLEMLALQKTRLSDVIAGLPPFHIATGKVDGVWETKARVMLCLARVLSKLPQEVLDGLKVNLNDHEWVLVRPDTSTASFSLVAEGRTLRAAQEIIADYGGIVHKYVQAPCSIDDSSNELLINQDR
jgi:mannose-1-phosphate guanylyltransferase/phosphomannomutase